MPVIADTLAVALSAVGLVQAIAGAMALKRFVRRPRLEPTRTPPVTVLKPLYGDEPLLEEALSSVCRQDYPVWQVVFGVQNAADTALPVAQRLKARFAGCDIAVVIDPATHGANRKIGNLINMLPAAKHDVLVIADSDVHVAPDWLRQLAAALEQPGVGLATAVYTGLPAPPPQTLPAARVLTLPSPAKRGRVGRGWSELGAMQINQYFLPGALLARVMGRQDCLGATMALRCETLERVGGFHALADHLADDNVLGRLVQRLGLKVVLADTIPATTVAETTLRALWRHELRWARTIRALEPAAFAASALQYPLVWALLAVALAAGAPWSLAWFVLAWAGRAAAARAMDRALRLANRSPLWLLPVRELMSLAVMAASYAGRRVDWRGYTLEAEGFNPR
jgi:ceramide glucosyltransferase